MVFEMFFVRRAYAEILAHELKKTVRMLRTVPTERFDAREAGCGASARPVERVGRLKLPAPRICSGPTDARVTVRFPCCYKEERD